MHLIYRGRQEYPDPGKLIVYVRIFAAKNEEMKRRFLVYFLFLCVFFLSSMAAVAQCSICTKTAQQLGEGPAKALNGAIIYLAFTPFLLIGYIGYRWWKSNREP